MSEAARIGDTIGKGRFKLLRSLGRGTFGDVYLAESVDPQATAGQREAVIKVLHTQWAKVPEVVERFRRESMVTQKIDHPHVARVFLHGELSDGVPFIAMEYLPGKSLRDRQEEGGLSYDIAMDILISIADALSAAHRAGVVHRDLKPENIQLIERNGNPNYPVVLDFGVAKFLDAAEKLTMTGALLGTPAYMSPEQFRGESNLGPPSDIYALGVLGYELLAGRLPFAGRTFAELAVAHTTQPAPLLPNVPPPLTDLFERLLSKEPQRRPRAEILMQSLRSIKQGAPPPKLPDVFIDPYAATGRLDEAVRTAVISQAAMEKKLQQRQQLYTILLAGLVFVFTCAIAVAIYMFLL
jgi:serine/threonine protein kinase